MRKEGDFDSVRKNLIDAGLLEEKDIKTSEQKKPEIADDDYVGALAIYCQQRGFHPPLYIVDPIEGGTGFWSGVTIEKIERKLRKKSNKEFYGNRGIGNTPDAAKNAAAQNLLQYMIDRAKRY